jgi:hypothetical protein
MTLQLKELNPQAITASNQLFTKLLSDIDPETDFAESRINSHLVNPMAVLYEYIKAALNKALTVSDLSYLETVDDEESHQLLDKILSRYKVTRKKGTKTKGKIRLVSSRDFVTYIDPITLFVSGQGSFRVLRSIQISTLSTMPAGVECLVWQPEIDGTKNYFCVVDVVSEDIGVKNNLVKGAVFDVLNRELPFLVEAKADSTFTSGTDEETNAEVISRLRYKIASKSLNNPFAMKAFLDESFLTRGQVVTVTSSEEINWVIGLANVGDTTIQDVIDRIDTLCLVPFGMSFNITAAEDVWVYGKVVIKFAQGIDELKVRMEIANAVNNIELGLAFNKNAVLAAVYKHLPSGSYVEDSSLYGKLHKEGDKLPLGIIDSSRHCFYCDPKHIEIVIS